MINTEIRTREELVELVNEIGFLPFFSGNITLNLILNLRGFYEIIKNVLIK